jgi:pimeloyl-ACP methyl ester carboxylesterase
MGSAEPCGYRTGVEAPKPQQDEPDPTLAPPPVYDEFSMFADNATEAGLAWTGPPAVDRVQVALPAPPHGRTVSALRWSASASAAATNGDQTVGADVVFVHGSAQNAHTWDTVCLALGPGIGALCIDLPGHGKSGWRDDQAYDPSTLALDIAPMIERYAPNAKVVVGMSLGGMTVLALGVARPELVRSAVIVDITPGVTKEKAKAIFDFVNGPQAFQSFEELLARTMTHNPTRSPSSLRRGILHNAAAQPDGSWHWRYDRRNPESERPEVPASQPHVLGWDDLAAITAPVTLVRGGVSPVVTDDDVAEWQRRRPVDTVIVVDGAGHSVQGDRPVELAAIVAERLDTVGDH